jgi:plastocyanin
MTARTLANRRHLPRRQCVRWRWLQLYRANPHEQLPVADHVDATASLAFTPATLTTQIGHAVTFAFGSVGHNIFFDAATGASANIPGVNSSTSITRTFDTPGTFTYSCHIHPFMQAKVVVN